MLGFEERGDLLISVVWSLVIYKWGWSSASEKEMDLDGPRSECQLNDQV